MRSLLLLILFHFCFDAFAQGPNPQVGMRVGGSKNPNSLCEGDTLWLNNLTQDSSRTVAYYVFNWNWKEEAFYPNYRDTIYNKDSVYHIYRFHDTIVYKNCKDRSKKLYVSLTAVDTFNDEFEIVSNIVMYLEPRSSFSGPSSACVGDEVTFTSSSCPIDTSIDFLWEIEGKTYTSANAKHKFTTPGRHKVKLTQESGNPCPKADSSVLYIDIYEYPIPGMKLMTLRKNNSFCFGKDTLKLINQSSKYTSIQWLVNPGDTTRLKWLNNTFPWYDTAYVLPLQTGTYRFQLRANNYICWDTTSTTYVNVIISPEVQIKTIPACLPDTGITLSNYLDTSQGIPDAYFWTLYGPNYADSGAYLPTNKRLLSYGSYQFSFFSNGICDTFVHRSSFFIKPNIVNLRDSIRLCNLQDSTYALKEFFSPFPTGFGTRWKPDSLLTNHAFNPYQKNIGIYKIFLSDSNSTCYSDSLTLFVESGSPQKFRDTAFCILADSFKLNSSDPGVFQGNGVWQGKFVPASAGPGNHSIYFHSDSSVLCPYSDTFLIQVHDTFSASLLAPNPVCIGKPATFVNTSGRPARQWSFGDNTYSTDSVGIKTYGASGFYLVKLASGHINGCIDTVQVQIQVLDTPSLHYGLMIDSSACDSLYARVFFQTKDPALLYYWVWQGDTSLVDTLRLGYRKDLNEYFTGLSVHSNNPCETKKDSLVIRIPPIFKSELTLSGPPKLCTPFEAQFAFSIYGHYDSFSVDYGNGSISTDTLYPMTYVNPGSTDSGFTVRLTSYSHKCGISADSVILTVAPNNIQPNFTDNSPGCRNSPVQFTNLSSDSIENWSFGDASSSVLQHPAHSYSTTGLFTVSAHYKAPFGCKDTLKKTLVIHDIPSMNHLYLMDSSLCDSVDVILRIVQPDTAQTYTWEANAAQYQTDSLRFIIPKLDRIEYLWPYKVRGQNICGQIRDSNEIRIPPKYHSRIQLTGPTKSCTPYTAGFTWSIYGHYDSFLVNYGNGVQSLDTILPMTYVNPGSTDTSFVVRIHSYSSVCGQSTDSVVVTVAPNNIQPDFSAASPGCKNSPIAFLNLSSDSITSWNFGDAGTSTQQNPNHTYTKSGTFDVSAFFLAPFGCKDTLTKTVVVHEAPKMSHMYQMDTSLCDSVHIVMRIAQPDTAQIYTWEGNSAQFQGDTVHFTVAKLDKADFLWPYKIRGQNICGTISDSGVIRIPPKYHSRVYLSGPPKSCTPFRTGFGWSIYGHYDSFWVDYGDQTRSKDTALLKTYYNHGNKDTSFWVKITSYSSRCGVASDSVLLTVAPNNIQPNFSITEPGCVNTDFQFSNLSSDSLRVWHFGNGDSSSGQNPVYRYKDTGTFHITAVYKAAWNCADTAYRYIRVIDIPKPDLTWKLDSSFCDTLRVIVQILNPDTLNSYLWTFGPTDSSGLWEDTFYLARRYTAYYQHFRLTASNICGQSVFQDSLYVSEEFRAEIVVDGLNNGCSPFIPKLDRHLTDKVQYYWVDYGNGDTSVNRIKPVTFYNTNPYTRSVPVIITGYNIFCDSIRDTTNVLVKPVLVKPYAEFNRFNYCQNEVVTCVNNSSPEAFVRIFWGDGSTLQNLAFGDTLRHQYSKPGIYTIQVEAESCGRDTSQDYTITIEDLPAVDFKSEPAVLCAGEAIQFIQNTNSAFVVLWRINGKDTAHRQDTFSKTFAQSGPQNIELVMQSSMGTCRDSTLKTVQIQAAGQLNALTTNPVDCVPHPVCLQVAGNIQHYTIDWGNGYTGSSTDTCETYTYADTFKIMVNGITSWGCPAKDSLNIYTHPELPVDFTLEFDTNYCDRVLVKGSVLLPNSLLQYRWNLDTHVVYGPVFQRFIPKKTGATFEIIRLTAQNLCSVVELSDTIYSGIKTLATLGINGMGSGCSPFTTQFVQVSHGALDSFVLEYGDGTRTVNSLPPKTYYNPGDTTLEFKAVLKVFSKSCPPETDTVVIRVFPMRLKLGAQLLRTSYCLGEKVQVVNQSSDKADLTIDFGDQNFYSGSLGFGDTIEHLYAHPGDYSWKIRSSTTCIGDSIQLQKIHIDSLPVIDFDMSPNPICEGAEVRLFARGSDIYQPIWVIDQNDTVIGKNPYDHIFLQAGNHTVQLGAVSLRTTCRNTLEKNLTVFPGMSYQLLLDTPVCEGAWTCLHVQGTFQSFSIDWGNNRYGDQKDTCLVYENPGEYPVTVQIRDPNSCQYTMHAMSKVYPNPVVEILPDEDVIELEIGKTIELNFQSNQGFRKFHWELEDDTLCTQSDPDCLPLLVGPFGTKFSRLYKLGLTDRYGCHGKDEIWLKSEGAASYYIPNAFTPNAGSDYNNTFRPVIIDEDITEYEMLIFNRWGEILFHKQHLERENPGWNGMYNGDLCEPELYGVIFTFKLGNGTQKVEKGYVMLLR